MRADDVEPGVRLSGLASGAATIVAVTPIGDALQVTIRDDIGKLTDQVLFPDDIAALQPEAPKSRWSFDADPGQFRLAAEALRMRHAGLSDPMLAVETSDIDPLPHQIRAVYGTLLAQAGSCASCSRTTQVPARRSWLACISRSCCCAGTCSVA